MASDGTSNDPIEKHPQPETEGEQLPGPGESGSLTENMGDEPDHGEETYRGSGRLTDMVAIVTGGDSGIGRAVALAFAREGADVVLSYLEAEEDDAQRTAELVEESGRKALRVPGDLTSEEVCRQLVDRTVSELGRVDIL